MEFLLAAAIAAAAFFAWQGFRTRCPHCGTMGLHPKDKVLAAAQQERFELMKSSGLLESLDQAGSAIGSSAKPGYVNTPLQCKQCGHLFKRSTAAQWLTIANKVGEDTALKGYKELEEELKRKHSSPS